MTNREKEILELIKKNPMISQKDLADILGITRSSVAVHITNLQKKGYILGKGYIVKEGEYVSIVGGANVDIQGFPKEKFILKDSNPGYVKTSLGGVGRNIGENLARLGVYTKLITVIGDDANGNNILENARSVGLDMEHSMKLKEDSTSTYLALLNEKGDMEAAVSSMDIFDNMTVNFIEDKKAIIENSKVCVIDTNIPQDVIKFIITNFKGVPFFLDTVSTSKARKVKDVIGYFHTIKPNKYEAELLSGMEINSKDDVKKAAEIFLDKGVKRVFITLGEKGVYYNDGVNENFIKNPKVNIVSATGAGDAFDAGLVYCYLNDFNIEKTAYFSMAASILTLLHENTINPNMSEDNINKLIKELKLC